MKAPQALPVAQQSNGYDCGVYTVMFAELFMQAVTGSAASDGQALDSPDSIRTAVFTDLTPAAVAAYRLKCIRDIQELCSSR
jgi:Ulp1 family protease